MLLTCAGSPGIYLSEGNKLTMGLNCRKFLSRIYKSFKNRSSLSSNLCPKTTEHSMLEIQACIRCNGLITSPLVSSSDSKQICTSSDMLHSKLLLPNPKFLRVDNANVLCSFHKHPELPTIPVNVNINTLSFGNQMIHSWYNMPFSLAYVCNRVDKYCILANILGLCWLYSYIVYIS